MLLPVLLLLAGAPSDLAAAGVVVAARPERSVVLLRSGGRSRLAGPGDVAFGGRVQAVTADGATLLFGDEVVQVRLAREGAPLSAPLAAPAAVAAPPETTSREMTRAEVQKRLTVEVPRILSETTLAPVMEDGHVAGFNVTRVPANSLLTDAGLQAGDVVTRVNGVPIDSMATLIGLWPRLQNEPVLRADILRNGQPLSLTVTLK